MDTILQLPIRFELDGFLFWQVCRTGKAAIYEQRTKDGRSVFYEVWAIRMRPARVLFGSSYPTSERGPGKEDWGKFGWTFYDLTRARIKYDQLNAGQDTETAGNGLKMPIRATNGQQSGSDLLTVKL